MRIIHKRTALMALDGAEWPNRAENGAGLGMETGTGRGTGTGTGTGIG